MMGHYKTRCCLRTINMYANLVIFSKKVKIYKSKFMKSGSLYQNEFCFGNTHKYSLDSGHYSQFSISLTLSSMGKINRKRHFRLLQY